ncbi:MAG: ribulose-phosphate 3-epimerase [Elusimicrobia bacterium]|nr:ribulose-phosphate 3-epimerase [Elusimicrobiota bacterium]
MSVQIAPSILSADFSALGRQIRQLEAEGARIFHMDVMDGHFVPNITFGSCVIRSLRRESSSVFDVHLMIKEPHRYINDFSDSGADYITFHLEAGLPGGQSGHGGPAGLVRKIKRLNKKAGMSIKPSTPVSAIYPFIRELDLVLVMSVEPGFGGQEFMPGALKKIKSLREYIDKNNCKCLIEVDGGINEKTIGPAVSAGADVLVCGNSIFGRGKPAEDYKKLVRCS